MPAGKTQLVLRAVAGGSRGGATDRAAIEDERQSINDETAGVFEIESLEAYNLGTSRDAGEPVGREVSDDDVVMLELADGGQLWVSVGELRELTGQETGDLELTSDTRLGPEVSESRGWTDWIRRVFLPEIDWGKTDLKDLAAKKAVRAAIRKIEGQLIQHGGSSAPKSAVYSMDFPEDGDAKFNLLSTEATPDDRPYLMLIHGTASSTEGSFAHLWGAKKDQSATNSGNRRTAWRNSLGLAKNGSGRYAGILALEHCTLSETPIENACTLLERLPPGQKIHVISHSRGGLVGELICRGGITERASPVIEEDIRIYLSAYDGLEPERKKELEDATSQELSRLNKLLKQKRPVVDRFVRVGCPSRGTTLASGRLDIYLNLILSAIQAAGAHFLGPITGKVLGTLKSLAIAVARSRFDHSQLPGLHAQVPDGGLARLINDARVEVNADLTIIAGDSEAGHGLKQTLLVALTNLYYWQANDWVVETDAMTGGHPRTSDTYWFYDDGKDRPDSSGAAVNHFAYFRNQRTFDAIVQALDGTHQNQCGFKKLAKEPPRAASRSSGGEERPPKCITVMLPGLPGTHLQEDDDRIWLHIPRIALGKLDLLDVTDPANKVLPDGWFSSRYEELADYLVGRQHQVEIFDYDWRLKLSENRTRLAARLAGLADEAREKSLDIRLLAHSMGGWVSLQWLARDTDGLWDRLCREHDARLIMAGTPLKGTYDTMQLLTDNHQLLTMIALVDFEHDRFDLIDKFRRYPGLLETLPGADDSDDKWNFFDVSHWKALKPVMDGNWRHPRSGELLKAHAARNAVPVDQPPQHSNRILYVAGQDNDTPCGLRVEEHGIAFHMTDQGDGLATWDSIPEWLNDGQCWYMQEVKHGDLFRAEDFFPALCELVESGRTNLLSQSPPLRRARGAETLDKVSATKALPPPPVLYPSLEDLEAAALHGLPDRPSVKPAPLPKCHIRIRHGDLRYADVPVMVGHYADDSIEGTEAILDQTLDGYLTRLHRANLYPGPLNTVEIATFPGTELTSGAVVVGMGLVGRLSVPTLKQTLHNALIRFGLDRSEKDRHCETGEPDKSAVALATLVIGSGTGGLTLKNALKAMLEATEDANLQLREIGARLIERLDILELFEDQAIAIAKNCHDLKADFANALTFDLAVRQMSGQQARPYCNDHSPWWRRIQVTAHDDGSLEFAPLTERAGIDLFTTCTQARFVDNILRNVTAGTQSMADLQQTLFEILIPNELKAEVEAQGGMVLLVNHGAAIYPWELLVNRRGASSSPIATRIGLIRQVYDHDGGIKQPTFRNKQALVVGDTESGSDFSVLNGAQAEAIAVCRILNANGFAAGEPLIRPSGLDLMARLFGGDYQIMHLAGHGVVDYPVFNERRGRTEPTTGMLLGNDIFLTSREIKQIPVIPEIVFINCCHLGADRESTLNQPGSGNRHRLAANLGMAFIRAGVKCVIAAGWEVDDAAARLFAETFYRELFAGESFGDAVTSARQAVYERHPNTSTWGAYQCYGDHAFRLRKGASRPWKPPFFSARDAEVFANNISGKASVSGHSKSDDCDDTLLEKLDHLANQVDEKSWLNTGAVCAAMANAYHDLEQFELCIQWAERARQKKDGGVPLKTLENRANALSRFAFQEAEKTGTAARKQLDPLKENAEKAIDLVQQLIEIGDTSERRNLLASAHKHLGGVLSIIAETSKKGSARREKTLQASNDMLRKAYDYYLERAQISLDEAAKIDSYPLLNAVGLWFVLGRGLSRPGDGLANRVTAQQWLDDLARQFHLTPPAEGRQRFWDRTDRLNLALYQALMNNESSTKPVWNELVAEYRQEFSLGTQRECDSVIKQIRMLSQMLDVRQVRRIPIAGLRKLTSELEAEQAKPLIGET